MGEIQNKLAEIMIVDYVQYHDQMWVCPTCRAGNCKLYELGRKVKCEECGAEFEIHLLSSAPTRWKRELP